MYTIPPNKTNDNDLALWSLNEQRDFLTFKYNQWSVIPISVLNINSLIKFNCTVIVQSSLPTPFYHMTLSKPYAARS